MILKENEINDGTAKKYNFKLSKVSKSYKFNDIEDKENNINNKKLNIDNYGIKKHYKIYFKKLKNNFKILKLYKEDEVHKFRLYNEKDININKFDYIFKTNCIYSAEDDYDSDNIKMELSIKKTEEDLKDTFNILKKRQITDLLINFNKYKNYMDPKDVKLLYNLPKFK